MSTTARAAGWAVLLLAVVALGQWTLGTARRAGAAEERARVAEARADSAARDAARLDSVASTLRASVGRAEAARAATQAEARRTQSRLSGAASDALAAAADSAVQADSLRRVVVRLVGRIREDSVAQAARERAWLAEGLSLRTVLTADSTALRSAWRAIEAHEVALAAAKAAGQCRWLFGRVECPSRTQAAVYAAVAVVVVPRIVRAATPSR